MKIPSLDNNGMKRIYAAETEAGRAVDRAGRDEAAKSSSGALAGKDGVSLSENAKLLAKAAAELNAAPEVRADLVTQLREQIENGEYQIPYEELAKRMINVIKPEA